MRVSCNNVFDFLDNLKAALASGETLLQNCIRISKDRKVIDEIRSEVVVHLSAVMILPDGGEYILHAVEPCGTDYGGRQPEMNATKRLTVLDGELDDFCRNANLTIRPGVVDI